MKLATTKKDIGQVVELLSEGIRSVIIRTDAGPIHIDVKDSTEDGIFKMINGEDDWFRHFPTTKGSTFLTDDPEGYVESNKKDPKFRNVFLGFEPQGYRFGVYPVKERQRIETQRLLEILARDQEVSIYEIVEILLTEISATNSFTSKLGKVLSKLSPDDQKELITFLREE